MERLLSMAIVRTILFVKTAMDKTLVDRRVPDITNESITVSSVISIIVKVKIVVVESVMEERLSAVSSVKILVVD